MALVDAFRQHKDELLAAASASPFIVFLCGPNLKEAEKKTSAALRRNLKMALEEAGFEVVLGEDEGLDDENITGLGVKPPLDFEYVRL